MRSMGNCAIAAIHADVNVIIVLLSHPSRDLVVSWSRMLRPANIENDKTLVSECALEVTVQVARKLAIVIEPPKCGRCKDDEFGLLFAKPFKLANRMCIVLWMSPVLPVLL